MEKLIRDGAVAVLYSPGFGTGWSTWNTEFPQCKFDPEIVAAVEAGDRAEAQRLAETKWPDGYWSAANSLRIAWIPQGNLFRIDEYDGSESIIEGTSDYEAA